MDLVPSESGVGVNRRLHSFVYHIFIEQLLCARPWEVANRTVSETDRDSRSFWSPGDKEEQWTGRSQGRVVQSEEQRPERAVSASQFPTQLSNASSVQCRWESGGNMLYGAQLRTRTWSAVGPGRPLPLLVRVKPCFRQRRSSVLSGSPASSADAEAAAAAGQREQSREEGPLCHRGWE